MTPHPDTLAALFLALIFVIGSFCFELRWVGYMAVAINAGLSWVSPWWRRRGGVA